MAELVNHETSGLLFKLNSADDLAQQLRRLIDDPALLPALNQGIPPVKTIDDEMQEVVLHYQQLLDRESLHAGAGTKAAD